MSNPEFKLEDFVVETMGGTEPESIYAVVANAKGLKLGIRPLIFGVGEVDSKGMTQPILHAGARLRVEGGAGVKVTPDMAESTFALLGFAKRPAGHVSQVIGVPLGSSYFISPGLVRGRWQEVNPAQIIVDSIATQLTKLGIHMTTQPDRLAEWLDLEYDKAFVEIEPIEVAPELAYGIDVPI